MNTNKDYYKILGLTNQSDISQIKISYRKLSKTLHPDKTNGDKVKEEQFKDVSEAYSILSNPQKKQEYDKMSSHGRNFVGGNPYGAFSSGNNFNPFDIFEQMFGGSPFAENPFDRNNRFQDFKENLDIHMNVIISLRDVYSNDSINIKYRKDVSCDFCSGTGFDPTKHSDPCEICDGSGKDSYGRICEYCKGSGVVYSETCPKCNGDKVNRVEEEFKLNSVKNVRENNTQYLQGKGHQSKYYPGKVGVLVLNVVYKHVKDYEINGFDLTYSLDVHYQDAIKGKKIEYEHLDSKKLKIKIPKKTNDGDLIRIKEKGLIDHLGKRGDLYFKINIIIDYDRE